MVVNSPAGWFCAHPEFERSTSGYVEEIQEAVIQRSAIERSPLNIKVCITVVVGYDYKFFSLMVNRVELELYPVEHRAGDFHAGASRTKRMQSGSGEYVPG